jgi:hypothetical protein
VAVISLAFVASASSRADSLTGYSLTDLGPGAPRLAGGGVVFAGDGRTAYPFQAAQDTTVDPQSLQTSGFPLLKAAPTWDPNTYGNPANAYSFLTGAMKGGNGWLVAVDDSGVAGHYGSTDVYAVRQDPNGGWGTPTALWSGGSTRSDSHEPIASITGINVLNEVLGTGLGQGYPAAYSPQAFLYNLDNKSLIDLNTLGVLQAGNWTQISPLAIDDQGRILLNAKTNDGPDQTLLLTPQGVTSDPLAVPAPEPGAVALAALTVAGLALRRAVRGRPARARMDPALCPRRPGD